jgi:hypothetical protein
MSMKKVKLLFVLALAIFGAMSGYGQDSAKAVAKQKKAKPMYECPMKCDKRHIYSKPGKCPVCGMDLREIIKTNQAMILAKLKKKPPCESKIDDLIDKKPLPETVIMDPDDYTDLFHNKKLGSAYLYLEISDVVVRCSRAIRYSEDSVIMLERVQIQDKCDYVFNPSNPEHPEWFVRGFPVTGNGEAKIPADQEIVRKLLVLFEK